GANRKQQTNQLRMDMDSVSDQLDREARDDQTGSGRAGIPVMERPHPVEVMRRPPHTETNGFLHLIECCIRMSGGYFHSPGYQSFDGFPRPWQFRCKRNKLNMLTRQFQKMLDFIQVWSA